MSEYLMTSQELLAPETGAIEIGLLKADLWEEIFFKMHEIAKQKGISNPRMIVDLIFKEGKVSELGSPGQPYPIAEDEWESFCLDVPEYCGDKIPIVYLVDGDKFTAPI